MDRGLDPLSHCSLAQSLDSGDAHLDGLRDDGVLPGGTSGSFIRFQEDPSASRHASRCRARLDGLLQKVAIEVTECNEKGVEARASARVVETVEKLDADVRVMRGGEGGGGTSSMGLMMLAASPGTTITVEATGKEATEVIEALAALIESRFGEQD